jgi:hypothetical protein
MSFWQSPIAGSKITGKPEDSFMSESRRIPNGTRALAMIKKFEYVDRFDPHYFQITWKLVDGEFKNAEVKQNIKAFHENDNSRFKALNMLKLIFDLAGFVPSHGETPTGDDLSHMINKIMGINILEWKLEDKDGNWVNEVHDAKGFQCETGIYKTFDEVETRSKSIEYSPKSALQEHKASKQVEMIDDDIPF